MLHKRYCAMTWQNNLFPVWSNGLRAFNFICFGKTLVAFDFDKKTCTRHCTNNYVISCVKRFYLPAFSVFQGMIWKNECHVSKNIELKTRAVKVPILILFHFYLLCWFCPDSVVVASCFNYIGLIVMVLACFRWF